MRAREPTRGARSGRLYLGAVQQSVGDAPAAARALQRAVRLDGNHSEARRLLGEACRDAEDWPCAARHLAAHARLRTRGTIRGHCEELSWAGAALVEAGELEAAREAFVRALQRCECSMQDSPQSCWRERDRSGPLLLDLGMAEGALGEWAAANASLSAAVELSPDLREHALPDLLAARAALADFAAASAARIEAPPWLLAALDLPAHTAAELIGAYAAHRRESGAAGTAWGRAAAAALSARWPAAGGAAPAALTIGVLVCGSALTTWDEAAAKALVLARGRGRHTLLVYDWCRAAPGEAVEDGGGVEEAWGLLDGIVPRAEEDGSVRVTATPHVRERAQAAGGAAAAAEGINRDGVAVLVSLDGWRQHNAQSVLALRPCPVQVAALGHRATVGDAASVQLLLAGRVSAPPELHALYTERLLLAPLGLAPPLAAPRRPGEAGATAAAAEQTAEARDAAAVRARLLQPAGEGRGGAVLAVLGRPAGLTEVALAAWGTVSRAVPGAVLLLPRVDPAAWPRVEEAMQRDAGAEGGARARAEAALEGESERARARAADVVLDPWAESAAGALALAAAGGAAGVTLPREALSSRAGAEALAALGGGAAAGVARSLADYAALAARLARRARAPEGGEVPRAEAAGEQWGSDAVRGAAAALDVALAGAGAAHIVLAAAG